MSDSDEPIDNDEIEEDPVDAGDDEEGEEGEEVSAEVSDCRTASQSTVRTVSNPFIEFPQVELGSQDTDDDDEEEVSCN
jgi:hypothetical protein